MHALPASSPARLDATAAPGALAPGIDFRLTPCRSLDERSYLMAVAALVIVSTGTALGLWLLGHVLVGAIVFFDGLFLMAASAAWRRDRRTVETVRLIDGVLEVTRCRAGRCEERTTLPAFGLNLRLHLDDNGEARALRLWHGRSGCEVAVELSAAQRASFARALHESLAAERLAPELSSTRLLPRGDES